ncbi:MAG: hypothetical protein Q8P41_14185 [Pseudomonadota bacterium]|nr:hypothetical protein [Pseudomonadota bacterium]
MIIVERLAWPFVIVLAVGCTRSPAQKADVPSVAAPAVVAEAPPPAPPPPAPAPAVAAPPVPPIEEPSPAAAPFDIRSIIGKNKEGLVGVLGEPSGCETVTPSRVGKVPKCVYRDGSVEVVFIKNRADWITVNGTESRSPQAALDVPFDAASLPSVGLSGTPTAKSPIGIFWRGSIEGVREVSMFGQPGAKVSYIYVKAFTD